MTFEEAKKILEKEGFSVGKATRPCSISKLFIGYDDPTICEAMHVVSSSGYFICMGMSDDLKSPVSSENRIKEDSGLNPALKESASQFNDALLDEQSKKIEDQHREITRLLSLVEKKEDSIIRLYYEKSVLEKENEDLKKGEIADHVKKIKRLGKEISRLNGIIHDKNEEIKRKSNGCCELVADELRLTKIREKNLAELGLKYVVENEKLKKELAEKVVDKIDAQSLKSAESALAYKEKVIAEKDDVISDLGKELKATKKELEDANKLVKTVRKYSKEYREYGIEAVKMIRKMAKVIVNEGPVSSKDFKEYRRLANGSRFNPQLPDFSEEDEKKLEHAKKIRVSSDNTEEGADLSGIFVLCGKDVIDSLKKAKDADIWQ